MPQDQYPFCEKDSTSQAWLQFALSSYVLPPAVGKQAFGQYLRSLRLPSETPVSAIARVLNKTEADLLRIEGGVIPPWDIPTGEALDLAMAYLLPARVLPRLRKNTLRGLKLDQITERRALAWFAKVRETLEARDQLRILAEQTLKANEYRDELQKLGISSDDGRLLLEIIGEEMSDVAPWVTFGEVFPEALFPDFGRTLGDWMTHLRSTAGVPFREIAAALEVDEHLPAEIESGVVPPWNIAPATMVAILRLYRVEPLALPELIVNTLAAQTDTYIDRPAIAAWQRTVLALYTFIANWVGDPAPASVVSTFHDELIA